MITVFTSFFRKLRLIWDLPDDFSENNKRIAARISGLSEQINERCEVHADIHYREPHQIIVIGKYHDRDYVRVFGVQKGMFHELIDILNREEKGSKVGRFDVAANWPRIDVVYKRDTF